LAFLSDRTEDKDQVFTLFLQGGDAVQRTEVKQGVKSFEWSPDSTRLVLVLKDPKPEEQASEEQKVSKEEKTPEPWVVDRLQFKIDEVGYLDRRRTHLHVLNLEDETLVQITSGDFDDSEPAWSPDGHSIAFVSNRTQEPDSNYNTDVWLVAADNQDQGKNLTQITSNPGPDTSPVWSPDGQRIAYVSAVDTKAMLYATNHLAVVPAKGGKERLVTAALDRNVMRPRFSGDGSSIYFILEDSGEQNLARVSPSGGEVTRVIRGRHIVERFAPGHNGTVAALISGPHLPAEVFLFRGGELRQISHTNDELLAGIRLGEMGNVHFPSRDGTEVEGFVVKPPDFVEGVRYPTLLWIHGGPQSQYDWRFDFEAQLFAAHGYLVVLVNPRGSTGYGQDFCLGIWQSWGVRDFEDVMAGVDWAIGRGWADPQRLGVGGWSYGGILTNYVITKTDRFQGAITGASSVLHVANYGHDQYQRWWEQELGLPWKNRELWEELSPFNYVEKVVTPTLILGGEKDWNVPVLNSEQLYQALRRLGRTTQLVVYPGEYHVLSIPTYIKDCYQRYLGWFDQHVKGKTPGGGMRDAGQRAPQA
jgi:dipeptidyl aminopeptidase/acylaminoacyl peptidase